MDSEKVLSGPNIGEVSVVRRQKSTRSEASRGRARRKVKIGGVGGGGSILPSLCTTPCDV
jgi:hypothetical protein